MQKLQKKFFLSSHHYETQYELHYGALKNGITKSIYYCAKSYWPVKTRK